MATDTAVTDAAGAVDAIAGGASVGAGFGAGICVAVTGISIVVSVVVLRIAAPVVIAGSPVLIPAFSAVCGITRSGMAAGIPAFMSLVVTGMVVPMPIAISITTAVAGAGIRNCRLSKEVQGYRQNISYFFHSKLQYEARLFCIRKDNLAKRR